MDYSFKEFNDTTQHFENRITITKTYSMGFPTYFYENQNIRQFKYVTLFFDQNKKAIGIHFHNDDTKPNKFKISKDKQGRGAAISITSFLKTQQIDPLKYYGRYEWTKGPYKEKMLYVIELKENKK